MGGKLHSRKRIAAWFYIIKPLTQICVAFEPSSLKECYNNTVDVDVNVSFVNANLHVFQSLEIVDCSMLSEACLVATQ